MTNIKKNNNKIIEYVVKITPYLAIFILAALIIKWYFFNIGVLQLWNDEYSHVFTAKQIIATGKPLLLSGKPYTRAIIYTYMVALSYKFLGVSEFSSRLPSVIIGFLILAIVFMSLKKTAKSIAPAIMGLAFLAFDPAMYWWSRICRMYILQALVFLICALMYYLTVEDYFNKKPLKNIAIKAAVFLLFFAVSFNIQQLTLLFMPVMVLYPIVHPKSKFDKKKLANYALIAAIAVAFYFILRFTIPKFNIIRIGEFIIGKFLPSKFKTAWASQEGYYAGYFLTNYMMVVPFFVFGVFLSFYKKNSFLILCSLISVVSITILSSVFAILVDTRFLLFILPFVYILVAVGAYYLIKMFIDNFELKKKQIYILAITLFFAAIFTGRANLQNMPAFGFNRSNDYRGVSKYLKGRPDYNKNQTVVSTLPLATIYYLNDTDYWLRQVIDKRFIISKNGKRVEYYSGVEIIDNAKVFSNLLDKRKVWLIADVKRQRSYLLDDMKNVILNKMTPIAQFNGVRLFINNRYAKKQAQIIKH